MRRQLAGLYRLVVAVTAVPLATGCDAKTEPPATRTPITTSSLPSRVSEGRYDSVLRSAKVQFPGSVGFVVGPLSVAATPTMDPRSSDIHIVVAVPPVPNIGYRPAAHAGLQIRVSRVEDDAGNNLRNPDSPWKGKIFDRSGLHEQNPSFDIRGRASIEWQGGVAPPPGPVRYAYRAAHLLPETRFGDINEVEGEIVVLLPVDVAMYEVPLDGSAVVAGDTSIRVLPPGKDPSVVTITVAGQPSRFAGFVGQSGDGRAVEPEFCGAPEWLGPKADLFCSFERRPKSITVALARKHIERTYPFVLTRSNHKWVSTNR